MTHTTDCREQTRYRRAQDGDQLSGSRYDKISSIHKLRFERKRFIGLAERRDEGSTVFSIYLLDGGDIGIDNVQEYGEIVGRHC